MDRKAPPRFGAGRSPTVSPPGFARFPRLERECGLPGSGSGQVIDNRIRETGNKATSTERVSG